MLYKDEHIVEPGGIIHYINVIFNPILESNGTASMPMAKQTMTKGRLFLTNHRIVLLSADNYQGQKNKNKNKNKKPFL